MTIRPIAVLLAASVICQAAIVDRIAIIIGNRIIKDSDIAEDLRITAFLNGEQPSFTAASRKKAASRLIDQALIRNEIEMGEYPTGSIAEANNLLASLKKSRYASNAAYEKALASYGISDEDVKSQLLWQLTVLKFIDLRFRPGAVATEEEIAKYFQEHQKELQASKPAQAVTLENSRSQIQEQVAGERVNQLLDEWLGRRRENSKIVYLEEGLK